MKKFNEKISPKIDKIKFSFKYVLINFFNEIFLFNFFSVNKIK